MPTPTVVDSRGGRNCTQNEGAGSKTGHAGTTLSDVAWMAERMLVAPVGGGPCPRCQKTLEPMETMTGECNVRLVLSCPACLWDETDGMPAAAMTMLPTPDASPEKFRLGGDTQQSRSLKARARRGELDGATGGKLNPDFVARMMGVPDGWLDLE